MITGVTVCSEIEVVCCVGGWGVDETGRFGAWGGSVAGVAGCAGDTMATFHLNGSSCGASWICFTSRMAVSTTAPWKRTETSQPWT